MCTEMDGLAFFFVFFEVAKAKTIEVNMNLSPNQWPMLQCFTLPPHERWKSKIGSSPNNDFPLPWWWEKEYLGSSKLFAPYEKDCALRSRIIFWSPNQQHKNQRLRTKSSSSGCNLKKKKNSCWVESHPTQNISIPIWSIRIPQNLLLDLAFRI